jgi:hypothetical protein
LSSVYCSKCGMMNSEDSVYCKRCGAQLQPAPVQDSWGRRRHHDHEHSHSGAGALIIGAIIIVAGLGVVFPEIPWDMFWATLLVLLGAWIIGFCLMKSYRTPKQ